MWDALSSTVVSFIASILKLLPESPFLVLDELTTTDYYQWLKWLNWFIPINTFIAILEAWLVGLGLYYIYQIVLRWVKAIQ
jgi:hypothetical protein